MLFLFIDPIKAYFKFFKEKTYRYINSSFEILFSYEIIFRYFLKFVNCFLNLKFIFVDNSVPCKTIDLAIIIFRFSSFLYLIR